MSRCKSKLMAMIIFCVSFLLGNLGFSHAQSENRQATSQEIGVEEGTKLNQQVSEDTQKEETQKEKKKSSKKKNSKKKSSRNKKSSKKKSKSKNKQTTKK